MSSVPNPQKYFLTIDVLSGTIVQEKNHLPTVQIDPIWIFNQREMGSSSFNSQFFGKHSRLARQAILSYVVVFLLI